MRIQVGNGSRESQTRENEAEAGAARAIGGWTRWLVDRLRSGPSRPPRLALIERIALAPRQSLSLVEADGRHFLVATSAEGGPAFFSLDPDPARLRIARRRQPSGGASRVSW
jgi:hypothetical protein